MFSKTLLIVFIVNFVSNFSYGQRDKKFFRKDYNYIEASESFYKFHTLQKTWFEAKRVCALEGASLFYAENDNEAHAVISFWNATQPFRWAYVGISDLVVKGIYETIDGHPVSDVYNNWGPGEPNDADGAEDCVILRKDGTLNDIKCNNKQPFICKKNLHTLEWNHQCNIPNLDYLYNQEIGRCYKFHPTPLSWTEAYAVCSAEQSYLAVINTQLEADYLVTLTETKIKKKAPGSLSGAIHLGFHNRLNEGWQAVRGTSLDDTGYVCWGHNQPDGEDREQCGSMFYNGLLNDISCDTRSFFICEHEVDILGSLFDDRFSDTRKLGNIYNQEIGRCYKFHTNPSNWTDAYAVCNAEQSYLAVINTQLEADYLVTLTESKTSKYLSGAVHLGFHNRLNEGWRSVTGTSLSDTGYARWDHNQPHGDPNVEQCGAMIYNGLLTDISCDTKGFFICEHEVDRPGMLFDDRLGNVTVAYLVFII